MKAADVLEHFLSRSPWVNRADTVDRIIVGDPALNASRCLVTWMPSMAALRQMVAREIRLMVCHEPTFWNHRDELPPADANIQNKLAFIREHGLTIIRNHDCWDRWPDIGIPWAWAKFLGIHSRPVQTGAAGYQHRYDIAPQTLATFSAKVAQACAPLGEAHVQVTGEPDQLISRIGIGTGCACAISTFMEMGCDCSIVCDDGTCYWRDIQRARDIGHPVIRVNHGTSEEPGMVTLTDYINGQMPGLSAEHLPHGSIFRLASATTC